MALSTYTELKAALADWLNRGDLTSQIVDFVDLCEDEIDRRAEVEYERRDTITLNAEVVTLPDDLREITSLAHDATNRRGPIDIVAPEELTTYKAISGRLTGFPRKGAVTSNGTELILAPVPDQSYVAEIIYATKLDRLSATVPTNWVLDSHSDVYLFGSLLQSAPFLIGDPREASWESRFEKGLAQLADLIRRRKGSANTPVMRPRRAIG